MNAEIARALGQREVRQRLESIGFEPAPGSADDFAAFLRAEVDKWGNIVRTAGIKQD
jgi:tripartite-type tricarboxylate transporter receptor subunit TctC